MMMAQSATAFSPPTSVSFGCSGRHPNAAPSTHVPAGTEVGVSSLTTKVEEVPPTSTTASTTTLNNDNKDDPPPPVLLARRPRRHRPPHHKAQHPQQYNPYHPEEYQAQQLAQQLQVQQQLQVAKESLQRQRQAVKDKLRADRQARRSMTTSPTAASSSIPTIVHVETSTGTSERWLPPGPPLADAQPEDDVLASLSNFLREQARHTVALAAVQNHFECRINVDDDEDDEEEEEVEIEPATASSANNIRYEPPLPPQYNAAQKVQSLQKSPAASVVSNHSSLHSAAEGSQAPSFKSNTSSLGSNHSSKFSQASQPSLSIIFPNPTKPTAACQAAQEAKNNKELVQEQQEHPSSSPHHDEQPPLPTTTTTTDTRKNHRGRRKHKLWSLFRRHKPDPLVLLACCLFCMATFLPSPHGVQACKVSVLPTTTHASRRRQQGIIPALQVPMIASVHRGGASSSTSSSSSSSRIQSRRWERMDGKEQLTTSTTTAANPFATPGKACSFYVWDWVSAILHKWCHHLVQDCIYEGLGGKKFVRVEPGSILQLLYPCSRYSPDRCLLCGGTHHDHLTLWWGKSHLYTPYDRHLDKTLAAATLLEAKYPPSQPTSSSSSLPKSALRQRRRSPYQRRYYRQEQRRLKEEQHRRMQETIPVYDFHRRYVADIEASLLAGITDKRQRTKQWHLEWKKLQRQASTTAATTTTPMEVRVMMDRKHAYLVPALLIKPTTTTSPSKPPSPPSDAQPPPPQAPSPQRTTPSLVLTRFLVLNALDRLIAMQQVENDKCRQRAGSSSSSGVGCCP